MRHHESLPPTPRRPLRLAAAALICLGLAGCGDGGGTA
ncbi:N-acetylmuramoyl-L-alanine amidase, partial [Streptomyces sp. SID9727]|nr:N-acetylmuramoyl-L-alanine amidase [Streptomyces sp. SID9727]